METPTDIVQLAQNDAARLALIWELTQALIAIALTGAMIWMSIHSISSAEMRDAFFIIIGFYFGRLVSKNAVGV